MPRIDYESFKRRGRTAIITSSSAIGRPGYAIRLEHSTSRHTSVRTKIAPTRALARKIAKAWVGK